MTELVAFNADICLMLKVGTAKIGSNLRFASVNVMPISEPIGSCYFSGAMALKRWIEYLVSTKHSCVRTAGSWVHKIKKLQVFV